MSTDISSLTYSSARGLMRVASLETDAVISECKDESLRVAKSELLVSDLVGANGWRERLG
jgi:hypothetical protein